ncbi:hypothetical protein ILYODFUR_038162 [Ilyodon furcidens]|uniref:Secreted protein n=1 Tax=Ilyodon furcidens TaxID=33524 RepID=A0ABV0SUA6_9TELE
MRKKQQNRLLVLLAYYSHHTQGTTLIHPISSVFGPIRVSAELCMCARMCCLSATHFQYPSTSTPFCARFVFPILSLLSICSHGADRQHLKRPSLRTTPPKRPSVCLSTCSNYTSLLFCLYVQNILYMGVSASLNVSIHFLQGVTRRDLFCNHKLLCVWRGLGLNTSCRLSSSGWQ